jgi:hypothetical protein
LNLHGIVSAAISAVNPNVTADWQQSIGNTTNADFSRTPSYAPAVEVEIQSQALTFKDLVQLSGVNIAGEALAFYVNGNVQGVSRPGEAGGDIFTFDDGSKWLCVHILENFSRSSGWTKCAVVRQVS